MGNHHGQHAPGATHEPVVHDPENDIDARSATIWVVAGSILLFVSLWIMLPIFIRVQDEERKRKIDSVPTTEWNEVHAAQQGFLGGQNPTKKTIDQVMKDIAAGK
jgi:hypothetical protein